MSENMPLIQYALSSRRVINIKYHSQGSQYPVCRDIEPLGMGFYEQFWHVIAYCRLRRKYRDFRLDRIEEVKLTKEIFDDKKHGSIQKIWKEMLSYKNLLPVILRIDKCPSYDQFINRCSYGLTEEKDLGDKVEVTLWSDSLIILGKWLLSYEGGIEIVSPPELKMIMKDYASGIAKQYMNPG